VINIEEEKLDEVTHKVAEALRISGINLSPESICNLNDTLAQFLASNECATANQHHAVDGEVIQLAFDIVSGTVQQQVVLLNKHVDEMFLFEGLRLGYLATSLNHDGGEHSFIVNIQTDEKVAQIISQEIDGEYEEYR